MTTEQQLKEACEDREALLAQVQRLKARNAALRRTVRELERRVTALSTKSEPELVDVVTRLRLERDEAVLALLRLEKDASDQNSSCPATHTTPHSSSL